MTATSTAASTQQAPSTAATTMTVDSTFTIPELKGLPLSLQAVIPEVKFSGHVYSPEPSRRMIMANQAVVREQDLITPETRLEEITETGVLLNYRGTRFRVELLPPL